MAKAIADREVRELILHKLHMGFGSDLITDDHVAEVRQILESGGDFDVAYLVEGELKGAEDFQSDPYYGAPYKHSSILIVPTK